MLKSIQPCSIILSTLLLSTCSSFQASSQESIDISYISGSVLVHAKKIEPISHQPVDGLSINYTFKNTRGEHWRKFYNFPNYGINYTFKSFNNPDVVGNAHALTTFLQLSFLKRHNVFDVGFKGSAGLAYLTEKFDEISNPDNQAISTHLNIAGEVEFYTRLTFHPVYIGYSYGLNHFSNGLIESPNLGLNTLNNHFTLGWAFEKQAEKVKPDEEERARLIKNEFWAYASTGANKVRDYDKRFVFFATSLNYSKQINPINKIGIGFDFINDEALNQYAIKNYNFNGESDLSFRCGPNLQGEFLFGNLSILAAYGIFFGDPSNYVSRGYYKVGAKYYAKNIIGIAMIRAVPKFKAQVIEFGLGYRFPWN
ncbi:acyloxyacyl hydrolase [Draconibacterium sp. IB214405]|uniref:acyloxyacyl hydrolase n=1 Tax=Draconibacterium sp. IB214405 TaxID=3097352 RepID=UPI002A12A672|nr:acyloxyacyl hydrolase [Draconibacterium sp. IB214405]MDX8338186.1 acyloxyacyl hydrolase [Draconibacterium sp. IB214405]